VLWIEISRFFDGPSTDLWLLTCAINRLSRGSDRRFDEVYQLAAEGGCRYIFTGEA